MKRFLLSAIVAIASLTMLAQSEVEYPQVIGGGYDYTLNGVLRHQFTTNMIKQVAAVEKEQCDSLTILVMHWKKMSELNDSEYGYDTIAQYI